jgi:NAD(P)-dependent dehydrogenase (short-subunit alcohol dehydrogenase family)
MQDLVDKVGVVTGGGSGIGRGIALALAAAGTHVVVADIDSVAAEAVAQEASALGVRSLAVRVDVAKRDSLDALARTAYGSFDAVHVLCNNAGVIRSAPLADATIADWEWMLAVNLMGPVHGVMAFLPRMRETAGERHIVNTGSMSGLIVRAGLTLGVYSASKHAVVAYTEALRNELAPEGIGVSVLCPATVATRISDAGRNRQAEYGGPFQRNVPASAAVNQGMDPTDVGRLVVRGIRENRLYIQTHREGRETVDARYRALSASFEDALCADRCAPL